MTKGPCAGGHAEAARLADQNARLVKVGTELQSQIKRLTSDVWYWRKLADDLQRQVTRLERSA